jgi:hypothetical protein
MGEDEAVARWVGERLGVDSWGPCSAIGIALDDRPIAGVVFNRYSVYNIEASIASDTPRWCTRGVLFGVFYYPFVTLGVKSITATTGRKKPDVQRHLARLGFRARGCLPEALGDDDAVIFSMTRRECRWLGEPLEQRQQSTVRP